MSLVLPSPVLAIVAYSLTLILTGIAAAALPNSYRLRGIGNWSAFLLLAGIPPLLAVPLTGLVLLNPNAAIPPAGMAVVIGIFWFHTVLPAVIPDFQTESFPASGLLAVLGGGAFYGSRMFLGSM